MICFKFAGSSLRTPVLTSFDDGKKKGPILLSEKELVWVFLLRDDSQLSKNGLLTAPG